MSPLAWWRSGEFLGAGTGVTTMVDATTQFFAALGSRGHEPLLENARGTLLVELANGAEIERWLVSIDKGDIEASLTDPTGLFSFDTRFLSKWVLTVDGQKLNPLSTDDLQYFETRFFLVPGTGTVYVDSKLSVIRQRAVGNGFHEELTILNHDEKPVDLTIRVDAGCDFADLFEVKDALEKKGTYTTRIVDGRLVLGYRRKTFSRETEISASAPARVDKKGFTFKTRIESHGEWTT